MADIACQTLYDDVAQELTGGRVNDRLAAAFPRAVNRALDELGAAVNDPDKFTRINSVDATIDDSELDNHYEWILYAGVVYYLIRAGHKPSDPRVAQTIYQDSAARWEDAKGKYWEAVLYARQSDSDNDMVRFGSVE